MSLSIETIATQPFSGQKPGTSGLRKKCKEVEQPHYLENFVQSVFDCLPSNEVKGCELVVSGDGRYLNNKAVDLIIRMAAANGVGSIVLGTNNLMSTPCVSGLVRHRKSYGAFILTASHNPGGPDEDFGIKYNCQNGGPAPESLTDQIYARTTKIDKYLIAKETPSVDITKPNESKFGDMKVIVVDSPKFYSDFMKTIFDFDMLKKFISRSDFSMIHDSMHGVAGPFAKEVFVNQLGAKPESCINAEPLEDFGGGHPDPNLTYAHDLVQKMGLPPAEGGHGSKHVLPATDKVPDFGAACDGDADRNMILGSRFFVTPSDSVAIIAANSQYIPYLSKGVKGVARSMPTSAALDRVAAAKGWNCYEVPTGWKFFGNLMDAGRLSICGEESFGTGSDHCREKDGMWAILAWVSILAGRNQDAGVGKLVSIEQIVREHWKQYGRNYYSRYDYEQVDSAAAEKLMNHLLETIKSVNSTNDKPTWEGYTVKKADEFTYTDPVDKSVSAHQGIRFEFTDGSRVVFRLSGTGSVGATIRVYVERYEKDQLDLETADAVKSLIKIALDQSKMKEFTGREKPTVIT